MNSLVVAVQSKDVESLHRILQRPRTDISQPQVLAALTKAVAIRNAQMVHILASHPTMKGDRSNLSPLLQNLIRNYDPRFRQDILNVSKILLDNGADIQHKDRQNRTCLHTAAYHFFTDAVDLFIQRGADVNVTDAAGCTPMMIATGRSKKAYTSNRQDAADQFATVLLLEPKSKLNLQDKRGKTALDLAKENHLGPVTSVLDPQSLERSKDSIRELEATVKNLKSTLEVKDTKIKVLADRIESLECQLADIKKQQASRPNPFHAAVQSARQLAYGMAQTAKGKWAQITAPLPLTKTTYHYDPSSTNHSESDRKEERKMLREIAKRLPRDKWKDLARELGLPESVIEELEQDYSQTGLREVKVKTLLTWKYTQPMEEATFDMLIHSLIKVDLMAIADEFAEYSVKKRLQQRRAVYNPLTREIS